MTALSLTMKSMAGFLAGLLLVTAGVLAFLVIPTVRDILALHQQLFEEKRLLEERYQRGMLFRQLREDWEQIQDDLPLLEEATISVGKSVAFITRLETLAREHGIQHRLTLPIDTGDEAAQDVVVPFEMHWRGSWGGLLKMLTALEAEPYVLPIKTVTVTATDAPSRALSLPFTARALEDPTLRTTVEHPLTFTLSGQTLWSKE